MLVVQICVGSSCHLKGSQEIVELMQKAVEEYNLDGDVVLVGSFCIGKCNREGVTVQINDDIHVGITPQNFKEFFKKNILDVIETRGSKHMPNCLTLKKSNCKNCYKCIRHCPVKAIRFSGNQAHIIGNECILCGQCFVVCPQNAKQIIDETER